MGTLYLQVQAGPVRVLLQAAGVHEVLDSAAGTAARGHVQWRDAVLPAITLGSFFGFDKVQPTASVVYGATPEQSPVVFLVDRVDGLRDIDMREWKRLPALPAEVTQFFDAAYVAPGQAILSYRLCDGIDPGLFGIAAVDPVVGLPDGVVA